MLCFSGSQTFLLDPLSFDKTQQSFLDLSLKQYRVVSLFVPDHPYVVGEKYTIVLKKTIVVKQLLASMANRSYFILPEKHFTEGGFSRLFHIEGLIEYHMGAEHFFYKKLPEELGFWVVKEFGHQVPISVNQHKHCISVASIAKEYEYLRTVYQNEGFFFRK